MAMTLEQVRDRLRAVDHAGMSGDECDDLADAIDAHLSQPAQVVDVDTVREVIAEMQIKAPTVKPKHLDNWAGRLTRSIGTAQEGLPKVRPLSEYHEDHGYVVWWAWDATRGEWMGEPAWIGRPDDDDWPGHHTHWTAHPPLPTPPTGEG